ncbi:hypothetical protein Tco_0425075, partial [Tanacetum coccineum]
ERVIEENPKSHSGSMSSMKNLDDTDNYGDQFLYDKPTKDDQEKFKVVDESDSTIPNLSHQTVTSTPPVIALVTNFSSPKPSSLLRVARLEQEMSEVKKTDHSADVLASIKSQVPAVIDKYLGTKLDDALLRILERHTADLIEKYSMLPGPESIKNQESKKSPKEIIRIKREQGEEKQESTYSIRSTDKVALEEFDLKNEDAMDKEVAVKVKDHKRKHDSDDDEDNDDDEGPQLDKPGSLTQEMLLLTLRCTDLIPNQNILNNPQMTFQCRMKGIRTGKKKLCKADLEGPSYHALVKAFIKNNRDKERKIALSISKLKAARYLDFGLEGIQTSTNTVSHPDRVKQSDPRFEFSVLSVSSTSENKAEVPTVMEQYKNKPNKVLVKKSEHPSETMVFHNEDGNPARANIKQALGYLKDGDGDGNSQLLRYQVDNRMLRHDLHLL